MNLPNFICITLFIPLVQLKVLHPSQTLSSNPNLPCKGYRIKAKVTETIKKNIKTPSKYDYDNILKINTITHMNALTHT